MSDVLNKLAEEIEVSLPSKKERLQVLEFLSLIVKETNKLKPQNWCLNVTQKKLKLTIGWPYIFFFGPVGKSPEETVLMVGGNKASFTKSTLAALKKFKLDWDWPTIRPVEENIVFEIPGNKLSLFFDNIEEFRKAILELLPRANTGRNGHVNRVVDKSKDDSMIEVLRQQTGDKNIPYHTKRYGSDESKGAAWIFQGNPKFFQIREYISKNENVVWRVSHHANEIAVGDDVFIWETGKEARILAIAEVTAPPSDDIAEDAPDLWLDKSELGKKTKKCRLTIITKLDDELTKEKLLSIEPTLPNIKFANATNFRITTEQHKQILDLLGERPMAEKINLGLNTIIYGPPGTGKTHYIQHELMSRFTSAKISERDRLQAIVETYAWWEVIGAALLDSANKTVPEILQHDLIKAKASRSTAKNVNAMLWSQLQSHADPECKQANITSKQAPYIFWKEEKSIWRVVPESIASQAPQISELLEAYHNPAKNVQPAGKRYAFITFHQSYSYEEFIEGIKPDLGSNSEGISYVLEAGIFKKMVKRAFEDPENEYAIFIDEINRGNISRIFGELITLIEEDKRLGAAHELKTILPYSQEEFGVPSNLFIIGTMNTADRSLVNIDAALRRRFHFEPLYPNPSLVKDQQLRDILIALNTEIRNTKDLDHQVGHSYFMGKTIGDLPAIMNRQVLPLLNEYFYGETETLKNMFASIDLLRGRLSVNEMNGLLEFK